MNFSLTDDELYTIARSLAYFSGNREATIQELSETYDLAVKLEAFITNENDRTDVAKRYGDMWGEK